MKYLIIRFCVHLPNGNVYEHHKSTYNIHNDVDVYDSGVDEDNWLRVLGHFVIKERSN